jgi:hypothetical protein
MPGYCTSGRTRTTDPPSYYRCPLSARLDAPTPLLPPGFVLLLIGGGCLCRSLRHLRHVAGRGARRKTEERGRRAPTRGTTLVVISERSGDKMIRQAAGHRQVADKYEAAGGCGSAADTGAARTQAR